MMAGIFVVGNPTVAGGHETFRYAHQVTSIHWTITASSELCIWLYPGECISYPCECIGTDADSYPGRLSFKLSIVNVMWCKFAVVFLLWRCFSNSAQTNAVCSHSLADRQTHTHTVQQTVCVCNANATRWWSDETTRGWWWRSHLAENYDGNSTRQIIIISLTEWRQATQYLLCSLNGGKDSEWVNEWVSERMS